MMVEDIADLSEDQWVHTFNINIHAYFYMAKYALRHMQRGAVIINNASINAYVGRPDLLDYTSSKGAIVSFTRGLSNQYVSKGIRVNAVAPGPGTFSLSFFLLVFFYYFIIFLSFNFLLSLFSFSLKLFMAFWHFILWSLTDSRNVKIVTQ